MLTSLIISMKNWDCYFKSYNGHKTYNTTPTKTKNRLIIIKSQHQVKVVTKNILDIVNDKNMDQCG